jgi:peptidoglycan biosynthesis protein MviN/MurJ (putative lipid II flippase)
VLNILLDVLLIPPLGALGAIIGTSVSSFVSYLLEFIGAQRLSGAVWPLAVATRLLLVGAAASLPGLLWPPPDWPGLIAQAGLFGLIYLGGLRLTGLLAPDDFDLLTSIAPRLAPWLAPFTWRNSP